MGGDVIKIEQPKKGDDIRTWGPPFLKNDNGDETSESGYYMSTGRNKRSVTIDFSIPEGRELLVKLMGECDVFVENYKVGGLKKYGLDQPVWKQYLNYMSHALRFDFGIPFQRPHTTVAKLIGKSWAITVQVGLMTIALTLFLNLFFYFLLQLLCVMISHWLTVLKHKMPSQILI